MADIKFNQDIINELINKYKTKEENNMINVTNTSAIQVDKIDMINHPSHYNRKDAMEAIDEMELIFGIQAVMHFCLCNIWKYRYRASDKNGMADLEKSDWYMNKYLELKKKFEIEEESKYKF